MDSVTIYRSNVSGIMEAPEFDELIEEYAAESSIVGMPKPAAKVESYRVYEGLGMLHAFVAVQGSSMIGFISVLTPVLPHYGRTVAVAESFFVAAAYRKTGAGLKLLEAAEDAAKQVGSPGLLVCAPFQGRLFEVLPRRGYTETNRIFFKGFHDA